MLVVDGARQIGKSYIIRHAGQSLFKNYIEINMEADKLGDRVFAEAKTVSDFYLALSVVAGDKMKSKTRQRTVRTLSARAPSIQHFLANLCCANLFLYENLIVCKL